jgi:transposase
MKFVGIDLHKKSLSLCVVDERRQVLDRKTFACQPPEALRLYLAGLGPFRAVVEATAGYEWLCELLEPLADRVTLAHPRKLRVIAESTRKSDRLDAQVLAEFLAADLIPPAHRPTPRQRQHRALVRHRVYVRRRSARAKVKIRRVLANYNADRRDLFAAAAADYLRREAPVNAADRFVLDQLVAEWEHAEGQSAAADKRLREFAKLAPPAEREARAALASIPGVGAVTVDVALSELGDIGRFRSAKQVAAYAGLVPGQRESAGKVKQLGLTKQGSRLLRWALVEAAWRLVRRSPRWQAVFERLKKRRGAKKAIVAIARRLLTVMVAVWRSGAAYDPLGRPAAAAR